jgi:hypothetical protein
MQAYEHIVWLIGQAAAGAAAESRLPGQGEGVVGEVGMSRGCRRKHVGARSGEPAEHQRGLSNERRAAGALHARDYCIAPFRQSIAPKSSSPRNV